MARNWHRLTRRLLFVLFLVSLLIGLGIWWQARERLKPAQSEPDDRIITLNLNEKGEVRLPSLDAGGDNYLTNRAQITTYMHRMYKESMKRVKPEDQHKGPQVRVVIRVDEGSM